MAFGMSRKEMKLQITAFNATRAAFHAIGADLKHIQKELRDTAAEAERTMHRAKSALGGLMGMMRGGGGFALPGGLGGVLGGIGAGVAVGGFTKMGLEANTFRENVLGSLEAMTKSKKEADSLFRFLSKFADVTPFDDQEIVSAGKALLTFGFDARKMMTIVGDTAFSMKVDLEQVVGVLAKLKSGQFDIAEMGPVGISREGLEKFGARFSKSGEPTNRKQLLPAGLALLQEKFGGGMQNAASGFDATFSTMLSNVRRVAREATTLLFGSLKPAFTAISAELEKVLADGELMKTLKVLFDSVARAIGLAAAQLPKFVGWLERVANADGVGLLLKNVIAFGMTVGQTFAQLSGIDLAKIFDPKNIHGWFEAFGAGIANMVNGVFGMARVWQELQAILGSFWVDTRDAVTDFAQDAVSAFKSAFGQLALSISQAAGGIITTIKDVLDALSKIEYEVFGTGVKVQPFKFDTAGLDAAKLAQEFASAFAQSNIDAALSEQVGHIVDRTFRDTVTKPAADPFRKDPFSQRIGDAFSGTNRDTSAQDAFWAQFEKNRKAVEAALFAPPAAAGSNIPPAPQMFGLDPKRTPTVNGLPVGATGAGMDPKVLEQLAEQEEFLKAHAGAWNAIVEASKGYADNLSDHDRASRGVLTAMMAQLAAQNQLRGVQEQILKGQPAFTKEWAAALTATNQTAKEIAAIEGGIRDLMFSTERLGAAAGASEKLFALGKDAGFDPEMMREIALEQSDILMQTMDAERRRLATLQAGTAEWFKQKSTIIDTIGKIVNLQRELSKANGFVDAQMLKSFRPRTPFGIRGAGAEPGAVGPQDSDLAKMTNQLLHWALEPRPFELSQEANRQMGGGLGSGVMSGYEQAASDRISQVQPVVQNTAYANLTMNVNDIATISRVAGQEAEKVVARAFQTLNGRQQDRRG